MRDTLAIPAFTSLLTSEPISATEALRETENSLSFHPRVLLDIDSLYLEYNKMKLKVRTTQ